MAYELDPFALRVARIASGLTQRQLGELVGVAGPSRVSAWERGRAVPHPHQLQALGIHLGVGVPALLVPAGTHARDLARLRGEAGLSLAELAQTIDVPVQTLKRWESGLVRTLASRAPVGSLARALGVSAEDVSTAIKYTLTRGERQPR